MMGRATLGSLGAGGAALLEAVVAMTILSAVGVGALGLATESIGAVSAAVAADDEWLRADRLMRSVSLWPAEELNRRLGTRPQGDWWMTIQRPEPGIYEVRLSHQKDGPEFISTTLYRP
jgi:hypothetical protein